MREGSHTHDMPIDARIAWLLDHARKHSDAFRSPEAWLARRLYHAEHPTLMVVLKCMDGRINIPVATRTPVGVLQPFRNLGGRFDLGWPHMGEVLAHDVLDAVASGNRVLLLITYHYSKGDPQRGCAGFDYDTDAARAHTFAIKEQVEAVFGQGHGGVYSIVCGFETDEDTLVLHGSEGEMLDVSTLAPSDAGSLGDLLARLFPDMPVQMRADLQPLVAGNIEHIAEIKVQSRKLDIMHREWMICLGRGFDWLHMPNLALIIGPYSPELADPIRKAASIIQANMDAGRILEDGFLLLTSAPYHDLGVDRARATMKSRFMTTFASDVIRADYPSLAEKMHIRTAVLDWRSFALELLDDAAPPR